MKRQQRKAARAGPLALLMALALCLGGCADMSNDVTPGKADDGTIELTSVPPENIEKSGETSFAAKKLTFQTEVSPMALFTKIGEHIFMYGRDHVSGACFLTEVGLDGDVLRDYDLSFLTPDDSSIAPLGSEDLPELWVMVGGESQNRALAYTKYGTLSPDGSFEEKFRCTTDDDYTISNIYVAADCLYMNRADRSGTHSFAVCAYDGTVIKEIKIPYSFAYKIDRGDGSIYIAPDNFGTPEASVCTVSRLNLETQELTEICRFDSGYLAAVKDGRFYINDFASVFEYSAADGITVPLFTWNGIGIAASGLIPLDDGSFLSGLAGELRLIYPSGSDNRQVLVLATGTDSVGYSDAVIAFNSMDPDYKIIIKDYSVYQNGQDILNTELISGAGPDIIDLTAFSDDIIQSGVLEDLIPYFKNDEEVSLDDIQEGPLAAMTQRGKLVSFIPLFTVSTFICPEDSMPEGGFQGIQDFEERLGDAEEAFGGYLSRGTFLRMAFSASYVDGYSEEDIAAVLRIARQLPESSGSPVLENGLPRFCRVNIGGVPPFRYYRISMNSNIAVAGLPFGGDSAGLLMPVVEFGMNSGSEAKEGVWRFFKFFLSPSVYESAAGNAFTLTKAGYEYALRADKEAIDEGMTLVLSINGQSTEVEITDTGDHIYCDELLGNVYGVYHQNGAVYKLVSDSAAKFFAGAASAEDAAKVIMSKLTVYYAERS